MKVFHNNASVLKSDDVERIKKGIDKNSSLLLFIDQYKDVGKRQIKGQLDIMKQMYKCLCEKELVYAALSWFQKFFARLSIDIKVDPKHIVLLDTTFLVSDDEWQVVYDTSEDRGYDGDSIYITALQRHKHFKYGYNKRRGDEKRSGVKVIDFTGSITGSIRSDFRTGAREIERREYFEFNS